MEIKYLENEPIKKYNTFHVGGTAKMLFIVKNSSELINICKYCAQQKIDYKIIGCGANILFHDGIIDEAIIVNRSEKVEFNHTSVYAESGVILSSLIYKLKEKKLSGLEKLSGIPSTLGGAITGNAGAFGVSISECIDYVLVADKDNLNNIHRISRDNCNFSYRNSLFKAQNMVILGAKLNLHPANIKQIENDIKTTISLKNASQPTSNFSAGSIFKRGNIIPAKIIDELGLKGLMLGDAQISTKHAGFIVNLGNASCEQIKTLIELVKNHVLSVTGEKLEEEIEYF